MSEKEDFLQFINEKEESVGRSDATIQLPKLDHGASVDERDSSFIGFLNEIAERDQLSDADAEICLGFLKRLYCHPDGSDNEYRHSYASICSVMIGDYDPNQLEPDCEAPPRMQHLSNNVDYIYAMCCNRPDSPKALSAKLKKLNDHVALEFQRFNYIIRQNHLQSSSRSQVVQEYERKLNQLGADLKNYDKDLKVKEAKLDQMEREFIAILGVFSAVVLFANGAISLSSSAISAIAGQNVVNVVFAIAVVGTCVFNMLYALFAFVFKLVKPDDSLDRFIGKQTFLEINKYLVVLDGALLVLAIILSASVFA